MNGNSPPFLVHQGREARGVLAPFLDALRTGSPSLRAGATVFVPRYYPSTLVDMTTEFDLVSDLVLADPETHRLEQPFDERGRARRQFDYLSESDPIVNSDRFVSDVLRAQVNVNRQVLVSPWLTHGTEVGDRNFRATLRFAQSSATHELAMGRAILAGLAIGEPVLRDPDVRGTFLNEVVELPEVPLYLRLCITPPESFGQYGDSDVLAGLRTTMESLQANELRVMLPQSGLVGWLMMAFGATAFGSGISSSLQRFSLPTPGFGRRPLEWYFSPSLLGFVLRQEVVAILNVTGDDPCPCPYCDRLPLDRPGVWSREIAGLHYLWHCARLANETAASPDRLEFVRSVVGGAVNRVAHIARSGLVLDQRSVPRHVQAWANALE